MAGMLELERSRTRRERTFIGSECAVCEEPLEHTLRGERILQFSCGHVSHEACFYEYIKEFESQYCPTCNAPLGLDTSRGGNVLDLGKDFSWPLLMTCILTITTEKLSSIVRSVSHQNSEAREQQNRSVQSTPQPWDTASTRERPRSRESNNRQPQRDTRDTHQNRDSKDSQRERIERYGMSPRQDHNRNLSGGTGGASMGASMDYPDMQGQNGGRRHDYDVQSMETTLSPRASLSKNPIPPPAVTVRSEYPTLNRSRQSQTLTCLITIEVLEGTWSPRPEDIRSAPVMPLSVSEKEVVVNPRSPISGRHGDHSGWSSETPEELEQVTQDLQNRVDNWHGLDFTRYGCVWHFIPIYK